MLNEQIVLSIACDPYPGEIPEELGDIATLERLNLAGNELSGKL